MTSNKIHKLGSYNAVLNHDHYNVFNLPVDYCQIIQIVIGVSKRAIFDDDDMVLSIRITDY